MYYDYFGFNQPPFKITPDTSLFYAGGDRGAILDALLYAILNGEGIVKVVGEVGSGKTMLCRMLEKELPENVEVVYLVNPSISPENTLHAIAFELKLEVQSATSRFEVMNQLQKYLLQRHSENRQVVVFVEEAQSMPIATLEEIRLLSNLETQQSKLLQIVLFGQPELDEMIARPEIRQLKERITYSFQLAPFKTNDIREYINSRVRACGYRAGELFNEAALRRIEHYSKGLLRRINILADKALLAAFAENSHKVTGKHTRLAARDSEFVTSRSWLGKSVLISATLTLLVVLIGGLFLYPEATIPPGQEDQGLPLSGIVENGEILSGTELTEQPYTELESTLDVTGEAIVPTRSSDVVNETVYPEVAATISAAAMVPDALEAVQSLAGQDNYVAESAQLELSESALLVSEFGEAAGDTGQEALISDINNQENQLLDISVIYPMLNLKDARLSTEESEQLRRQLTKLPPESFEYMSLKDDICEYCAAIIYRPVRIMENL